MPDVPSELPLDAPDTDAVMEAVLRAPDPQARADIIVAILHDLYAAIEWVHNNSAPGADRVSAVAELGGVRQLAAAAHNHRLRMSFSAASIAESR